MGAETARFLHHQGAKIALLNKQFNRAKILADELNELVIKCDVSDYGHAQRAKQAIEAAINEFRAITICINCAGIAPTFRIVTREEAIPLENFQRVIEVHLIGTFNIL